MSDLGAPGNPVMCRPAGISEFRLAAHVPSVSAQVLAALADADEKGDLEPALASIAGHVDETPHGPTEIADVLTVHLSIADRPVFAAIAIKGKAWKDVRARDVTYQLTRAAQVEGLGLLVLAAVGNIQDDVKRDLAWLADRTPCDWMILDRADLARIFIAYGRLCPNDATWLRMTPCPACGYVYSPPAAPPGGTGSESSYAVLSLEDVSHAGAKRYAAHLLVSPGVGREVLERRIAAAVQSVRRSDYSRNELVERAHGGRLADVVFLFVYQDVTQWPFANWIARAIWIASGLRELFRPNTFGVQTSDPELWIDWNESYEAMAAFTATHKAEKGPYLRQLDAFVVGATYVAEEARRLIEQGALTPAIERNLARLGKDAEEIPRPDPMLTAPFELSDLDAVFGEAEAFLGNLFLPFGERGLTTWAEPERRIWLARDALQHLDDAMARLSYERRKAR